MKPLKSLNYELQKPIEEYYNIYKIKTDNKIRIIYAPDPILKTIQSNVLKELTHRTSNMFPDCVHGFVKGKSINTAVEKHIGNKYIMTLDFKNFFPSHTREILFNKLNTKLPNDQIHKLIDLCTYQDKMVLGSPLSPIITNLCMLEFDKQFNQWCQENNITYTRYADDIILSNNKSKFKTKTIIKVIYQILKDTNTDYLKLNMKKLKFGKNNLLGINITNKGKLSVSVKVRRQLRAILFNYGINKVDFDEIDDKTKGLLSFIRMINYKQYEKLIENYYKGYEM